LKNIQEMLPVIKVAKYLNRQEPAPLQCNAVIILNI
jgi:hypothetical protein